MIGWHIGLSQNPLLVVAPSLAFATWSLSTRSFAVIGKANLVTHLLGQDKEVGSPACPVDFGFQDVWSEL